MTYLRHRSCTLVCILLHFLHSYSGPSGIVKKVSPSIFFSRSVFCIFSFRLSEKTTATLYFPKSRGGSEILRGRPDLHFANQKSMIVRYYQSRDLLDYYLIYAMYSNLPNKCSGTITEF